MSDVLALPRFPWVQPCTSKYGAPLIAPYGRNPVLATENTIRRIQERLDRVIVVRHPNATDLRMFLDMIAVDRVREAVTVAREAGFIVDAPTCKPDDHVILVLDDQLRVLGERTFTLDPPRSMLALETLSDELERPVPIHRAGVAHTVAVYDDDDALPFLYDRVNCTVRPGDLFRFPATARASTEWNVVS